MNPATPLPPPRTLSTVLQQAQMRVVLIAVLLVGTSVVAIGMSALRIYMSNNLELLSRALGYTIEAAVVFRDHEAADEALALMVTNNPVAKAEVIDAEGKVFASWQLPKERMLSGFELRLTELILPKPAISPIMHDGDQVGEVKLHIHGRDLLRFLTISLGNTLICLAFTGFIAYHWSRDTSTEIVAPLRELAQTAHAARINRVFNRRVAPATIVEIKTLGEDFNALLDEMELWQAQSKLENASLEYQANHDPLTGLCNRAHFDSRLRLALRIASESNNRLAVFFIDANRFKAINDEQGHEAGDIVLCTIASRLKSQLREGDLVARLGGDEFAVLLTPLRANDHALRVASNILASMAGPILLPSGINLTTSLSIGIAIFPDHGKDAAELLKHADEAMYRAKRLRHGAYEIAETDDILDTSGDKN